MVKSTKIKLVAPGGLSRKEAEQLRDKGVKMNDWDYVLVVPASAMTVTESGDVQPRDWYNVRFLRAPFCMRWMARNRWYRIHWHGKDVGIGVIS